VASPITLNPQTSLFEQTVHLTNSTANTVAAVRLLIYAPASVQVYNASGFTNGIPYLQYNLSLAPAATVSFLVEYYNASRQTDWFSQLVFVVQETTPVSVTNPTGTPVITRYGSTNVSLAGRFLIEFTATPGRSYAVQYSTNNMISWETANPIIIAPADRVQWYDDGPPKTESPPTAFGSRFYRVIELP
jgi:hypothetical protein